MNSTELIVTKHETSVTSRPHSQFYPCVTHHHHHHHHHPTVNQWRCWSDSSLVTLAVMIITTDDDDKEWQSRDCGGKTSTRREQLLFCDNLSIEQAGLARPGLPGWHPATLNCLSKKIIRIVLIRARSPGQSGQSDHHGPVTVTVESAGVSRY